MALAALRNLSPGRRHNYRQQRRDSNESSDYSDQQGRCTSRDGLKPRRVNVSVEKSRDAVLGWFQVCQPEATSNGKHKGCQRELGYETRFIHTTALPLRTLAGKRGKCRCRGQSGFGSSAARSGHPFHSGTIVRSRSIRGGAAELHRSACGRPTTCRHLIVCSLSRAHRLPNGGIARVAATPSGAIRPAQEVGPDGRSYEQAAGSRHAGGVFGGEGGIRSRLTRSPQRFTPDRNRQNLPEPLET